MFDLEVNRLQIVTVVGSIFFLLFILEAVRRQRLKEAYSLLWLIMGTGFLVIGSWHRGLGVISEMIGIAYAPATLFLILIVTILLILIQFSIVLSRRAEQIKDLSQELALLSQKVEKLQKEHQTDDNAKEPDTQA
jgi:hypothetical protein